MTHPPYSPPGPEPKKRNTTRTVIIVVALAVLLCCGGVVGGGYLLFRTVSDAIGPARDAATDYLDAVVVEDYATAYGLLCGDVREDVTLDDFKNSHQKITDYQVVGENVSTTNGRSTATVTIKLTHADGQTSRRELPLIKESDRWLVCELRQ